MEAMVSLRQALCALHSFFFSIFQEEMLYEAKIHLSMTAVGKLQNVSLSLARLNTGSDGLK